MAVDHSFDEHVHTEAPTYGPAPGLRGTGGGDPHGEPEEARGRLTP